MTSPSSPPATPPLVADILLAIENLFDATSSYLTVSILPWTTKTPTEDLKLYADAALTDIRTIWRGMVLFFGADAAAVEQSVRSVVTNIAGPLATDAANYWRELLLDVFASFDNALESAATIDPTRVDDTAAAALTEAGTLGLGSRIVTIAFEAVLPKQLNVMNWLGPILATFSGFDSIVAAWRQPTIAAAIGQLAQYQANTKFKTIAPPGFGAAQLFARGLISAEQRDRLFDWSGFMSEFRDAIQQGGYRAVQPFLLARAANAGAIPVDDIKALLTFAGFRPADITRLLAAFHELALQPYQQQYLVAAVRSTELGTMTPQELGGVMDDLHLNAEQQNLAQLTVATRKLEQLAEIYRKSISEAYGFGTLTDAQYVPALEAIGISQDDAQAHYAVDSIKKIGKAAAAEVKAEQRLAQQRTRAAMQAAIAEYRAEQIDEPGLAAALLAAQVDPVIAALVVTAQSARRLGPQVLIYGLMLHRDAALKLREKVAAVEAQYKKQLIDDAAAAAEISSLGIPKGNADALLADWAALKTKATTTGELLPI